MKSKKNKAKTIEITEDTLRGLYLILCGVSFNHNGRGTTDEAVPYMDKAHEEIIKLGKEEGFDNRGFDLWNFILPKSEKHRDGNQPKEVKDWLKKNGIDSTPHRGKR